MTDFKQLIIEKYEEIKIEHHLRGKRYVIGCDPQDKPHEEGFNVFTVYDKITMSIVLRLETKKKNFDEFVEWVTKESKNLGIGKSETVVSRKFITTDGKSTCFRIGEGSNKDNGIN